MHWASPFRSPVVSPSLWQHLLAVLFSMLSTVLLGIAFLLLGAALSEVMAGAAGVLMVSGYVLLFSIAFTWAGHIPGALILHAGLKSGWGGWAVAAVGGLVVGSVLTSGMGGGLSAVLGPFLAVLQLAILRGICGKGILARKTG